MPYRSQAQRKYFNAHRKELAQHGVDVDEWNAASAGKKLPARTGKKAARDSRKNRAQRAREAGHPWV